MTIEPYRYKPGKSMNLFDVIILLLFGLAMFFLGFIFSLLYIWGGCF